MFDRISKVEKQIKKNHNPTKKKTAIFGEKGEGEKKMSLTVACIGQFGGSFRFFFVCALDIFKV